MNDERRELEDKLYQIQKWFFENRNALTENEITVVYAFADKSRNQMNIFSGGKGGEIAAVAVGIAKKLMLGADNKDDLRKMFNLIAGKICRKFEQLIGEDDGDEEE